MCRGGHEGVGQVAAAGVLNYQRLTEFADYGDYITQLDKTRIFKRPIVTKTDTMKTPFFAAEAYHQDYAIKHPWQPYIAINDAPKVENLKKMFPDVWREQPVTVAEAGGVGG